MPDGGAGLLFLLAAVVVAITPGPGMLFVVARTVAGGRREGFASSVGTGLGGLVHVVAVTIGLSTLVMASAQVFAILKLTGGLYLVWLGVRAMRQAGGPVLLEATSTGAWRAFREGVIVEALNPKTAAFFLALLPQFVDSEHGAVAAQLVVLGALSVALNTTADLAAVTLASAARRTLARRPERIRRLRQAGGAMLCALGVSLALARRPT